MLRSSASALAMLICGGLTLAQSVPPAANPPNSYTTIDTADLNNFRVQAFSQDGTYLFEWKQFGMPGGLFIDRNDMLYVAGSLSGSDRHPDRVRGIRAGRVTDGAITAFIPDRTPTVNPITAAEGVAVDIDGNLYGSVVPAETPQKHVRR